MRSAVQGGPGVRRGIGGHGHTVLRVPQGKADQTRCFDPSNPVHRFGTLSSESDRSLGSFCLDGLSLQSFRAQGSC